MDYDTPLPTQRAQGTSMWNRASQSNVPSGAETTILSFTDPAATWFLDEVSMAGDFAAEFRIYLNGAQKDTERIEVGKPVARIGLYGMRLSAGDVFAVKVIHAHAGQLHAFEASLKAHQ